MKQPTILFCDEAGLKNPNQNPLIASPLKLLNTPLQCRKILFLIFAFAFGLTIGTILCFQLRSFSFYIQFNNDIIDTFSPPMSLSSQSQMKLIIMPPKITHNMSEEELLQKASMTPGVEDLPYKNMPKVSFMFLTRGPVLLAPFWEKFFEGNEGLYSIYIHTSPGNKSVYPEDSVFHDRTIPSKEVEWGTVSMIEAERRLLANALLDSSNQHFVLLSEACIPLFNFSTIYSYIVNSRKNFVELYDQPGTVGRGRYHQDMNPTITLEQWRKGSQWFAINRELAVEFVSDKTYFPVFQKHCVGSRGCYADEHYLPTLVNIKFGEKNSDRGLTWVDWAKGGPHPTGFSSGNVTPELFERMRGARKCEYNGVETDQCFMFARKFLPPALDELLRIAPVMHFK